jgi:hypothetical protein
LSDQKATARHVAGGWVQFVVTEDRNVNPVAVQKVMRHHDLNVTTNIYADEQMPDLHAAVDRLDEPHAMPGA